ncbi:MAG: PQQ-dependent sugar dehydrogenase [Actinomycetota bacterium]|nr:PQQ-dependent sugar dehydrogenase [Actinomycetota bacterium]
MGSLHRAIRLLRFAPLAAILLLMGLLAASSGARETSSLTRAGDGSGGVVLTDLGDFDRPVYTATAPGKANRGLLFVVEKGGLIRVIRRGKTIAAPFLDISERISTGTEQGLLSIAFPPDYAKTRRFYVYFTDREGDIRISQGRASNGHEARAKPSLRDVIAIPHATFANHNGGQVSFGPDGNLWVGTGDGGGACDPFESAQDRGSLLGKLLRITPARRGGYTIPDGNPFAAGAGADEIYAFGLRNPFRFSFDERSGTIAIGDVGQAAVEEIDYETVEGSRGANFGWDAFEGQGPFVRPDGCQGEGDTPTPPTTEAPIFEYGHAGGEFNGCSITGGLVVRDKRLPTLAGRYLYSDVCNGQLRSIVPALAGGSGDVALGLDVEGPTSFVSDRKDRVHVTSLSGDVYRLDPATGAGRVATGPDAAG